MKKDFLNRLKILPSMNLLTSLSIRLIGILKKIIKINTYYPSSKICSCCGEKNEELEDLSIKE